MRLPLHLSRYKLNYPYSIRAWRQLRYNKKYAEKLAKKAERKKTEEMERRAAQEAASRSVPKANPFSVSIYWHIRVQMPT